MCRGLKRFGILFTCLSVVMFSSIFVMADENDEDINLPVDVEQEVEIEESDEDEPFIIDENGNGEDIEDGEERRETLYKALKAQINANEIGDNDKVLNFSEKPPNNHRVFVGLTRAWDILAVKSQLNVLHFRYLHIQNLSPETFDRGSCISHVLS